MPKFKYVGPHDSVDIPSLGLVVKRGEAFDAPADADLGEQFKTVKES